ncbi:MAG: hypothetical protein P8Y91_04150 [Desulfuromonadales bacterium]
MMTSPVENKLINALCRRCLRTCKQPVASLLLECPRYFPLPFKVARHRFEQMDLFDQE